MPGSQPGPAAQAEAAADGSVTYRDPVTDLGEYTLPAGSPGAQMLAGPRAAAAAPPRTVPAGRLIVLPPRPGTTGRLVRNPDGSMGVTPYSLPKPRAAVPFRQIVPYTDPPDQRLTMGQADGSLVVAPLSAFGLPGDDAGPINSALLQVSPSVVSAFPVRGQVRLQPRIYNLQSTVVIPFGCQLDCNGATLLYSGSNIAVSVHSTSAWFSGSPPHFPYNFQPGGMVNGTIDGTNAGAGAVGLDYGDGPDWIFDNIRVANFTGAGSIGIRELNGYKWTEKTTLRAQIFNCTTLMTMDVSAGNPNPSHEYNEYDLHLNALPGQAGIAILNGSHLSNTRIRVRGNFQIPAGVPGASIALDIAHNDGAGTKSFITRSWIDWSVEVTGTGTATWTTVKFGADTANLLTNCYGRLIFLGSSTNWLASDAVLAQFTFGGVIYGDANLITLATTSGNKPSGWA